MGWRELFIWFALFFFCLTIWFNKSNILAFPILVIAWVIDDGLYKFKQILKEPLVQAILVLCITLTLGIFWGDYPEAGHLKWRKYYILLIFIPFLSLINTERLPWAIGALLTGYIGILLIGSYQWVMLGEQGVAIFKMSYLNFSAMLGVGVILAVYLAGVSNSMKASILLWIFAFSLLFLQFNQNARGLLISTLITISLLILLQYRAKKSKLILHLILLMATISIFACISPTFQERFSQVTQEIELFQQGNYKTSVGYRLAMWDVGLNGIIKQPFFGHGTGNPESYFENTVVTYKGGIYKDLPNFHRTSHYHHDWIELGMHLGLLGMFTLAFLLWNWCRTFMRNNLPVLGIALVSYIFLAGLTDTFILYSRIPSLLLAITALAICWQKENRTLPF